MSYRIVLLLSLACISSFVFSSENTLVVDLNDTAPASAGDSSSSLDVSESNKKNSNIVNSSTSAGTPLPPKSASPQVGSGILTADPYSVVVGLLLVLALIFGLAWLVRKMGPGVLAGGQSMKIISALAVGPREKVLLVDIGGQQILLGVAPGRVSHLRDFEQPIISEPSTAGGEFSARLRYLLQQGKTTPAINESEDSADISKAGDKPDSNAAERGGER